MGILIAIPIVRIFISQINEASAITGNEGVDSNINNVHYPQLPQAGPLLQLEYKITNNEAGDIIKLVFSEVRIDEFNDVRNMICPRFESPFVKVVPVSYSALHKILASDVVHQQTRFYVIKPRLEEAHNSMLHLHNKKIKSIANKKAKQIHDEKENTLVLASATVISLPQTSSASHTATSWLDYPITLISGWVDSLLNSATQYAAQTAAECPSYFPTISPNYWRNGGSHTSLWSSPVKNTTSGNSTTISCASTSLMLRG